MRFREPHNYAALASPPAPSHVPAGHRRRSPGSGGKPVAAAVPTLPLSELRAALQLADGLATGSDAQQQVGSNPNFSSPTMAISHSQQQEQVQRPVPHQRRPQASPAARPATRPEGAAVQARDLINLLSDLA